MYAVTASYATLKSVRVTLSPDHVRGIPPRPQSPATRGARNRREGSRREGYDTAQRGGGAVRGEGRCEGGSRWRRPRKVRTKITSRTVHTPRSRTRSATASHERMASTRLTRTERATTSPPSACGPNARSWRRAIVCKPSRGSWRNPSEYPDTREEQQSAASRLRYGQRSHDLEWCLGWVEKQARRVRASGDVRER